MKGVASNPDTAIPRDDAADASLGTEAPGAALVRLQFWTVAGYLFGCAALLGGLLLWILSATRAPDETTGTPSGANKDAATTAISQHADRPIPAFLPADAGNCDASYRLVGETCVHLDFRPELPLIEDLARYRKGAAPPVIFGGSNPGGSDEASTRTGSSKGEDPVENLRGLDPGALRDSRRPFHRFRFPDVPQRKPAASPAVAAERRSRCARARIELKAYQRDGVVGRNPVTGELERMSNKEDEALEIARKRAEVFRLCQEQGPERITAPPPTLMR